MTLLRLLRMYSTIEVSAFGRERDGGDRHLDGSDNVVLRYAAGQC